MTNNLNDLLPRFVLEDGTVLMPQNIAQLYYTNPQNVDYGMGFLGVIIRGTLRQYKIDANNARKDRQSPYDDKNGMRIFENDTGLYLGIDIKIIFTKGRWKIESKGCTMELYGSSSDIEITGMVPYNKEG